MDKEDRYFLAAFFAGFAAAALGLQPVLHPGFAAGFAAGFASVFLVAAFFVAISYGSFCRASVFESAAASPQRPRRGWPLSLGLRRQRP